MYFLQFKIIFVFSSAYPNLHDDHHSSPFYKKLIRGQCEMRKSAQVSAANTSERFEQHVYKYFVWEYSASE